MKSNEVRKTLPKWAALSVLSLGLLLLAACSGAETVEPSTTASQETSARTIDERPLSELNNEQPPEPDDELVIEQAGEPQSEPIIEPVKEPNLELWKSDNQGAVEVLVLPMFVDLDSAETLDFQVTLDTHSVELDMNLAALASLTTDTGMTLEPLDWSGGGGHHVQGILRFSQPEGGFSALQDAARLILTLESIDNTTRVFEWNLPLAP
jgi:hypothetical protein